MENELHAECFKHICDVNNEKSWNLSDEKLRSLADKIVPHVIASITQSIDDAEYEERKTSLIKTIAINYYNDGTTVEILQQEHQSIVKTEIFLKYQNYIKKIIKVNGWSLDYDDIDDISGNVLSNVFAVDCSSKYHFRSLFKTYLGSIIKNECHKFQKKKRKNGYRQIPLDGPDDNGLTLSEKLPSNTPEIDGTVQWELFDLVKNEIDRAVAYMNEIRFNREQKRWIAYLGFICKYNEHEIPKTLNICPSCPIQEECVPGLSNKEIGEKLGIPEANVDKIMHIFRERLKNSPGLKRFFFK
jgi:DNA-directed RNA polymerase specialized sigma24 family protein